LASDFALSLKGRENGQSLDKIADSLLACIFNMKAAQDTPKPLIVIMGENHEVPITQLLQYAVLHKAVEKGLKPAYGLELRYDFLSANNVFSKKAQAHPRIQAVMNSPEAHHSLINKDFIESYNFDEMIRTPLRLCLKHGLSFRFNDASRTFNKRTGHHMNLGDEIYLKALKSLRYKKVPAPLCIDSPKAMHIRNHIMCDKAMQQYKDAQPDFLLHMVGDSHVVGNDLEDYEYKHSLTNLCLKRGFDVLSVVTSFDEDEIPSDAPLTSAIHIQGWQKARHFSLYEGEDYYNYINTLLQQAKLPFITPKTELERQKSRAIFEQRLMNT
jgi:hypothetical protein